MTTLRMVLLLSLVVTTTPAWSGNVIERLKTNYLQLGASSFDPERGKTLWQRKSPHQKSGKSRSCTDCHGPSLAQPGRHLRTGKVIQPISPAIEPQRFSSIGKVEKWFKRNCKWTLGRTCSPQEKGDILSYIQQESREYVQLTPE